MATWRSLWLEHRFEVSGSLFAVGVILTFIAVIGYVPQARAWATTVAILDNILIGLGGWIFWGAIAGGLILIMGGFYFGDTIKKGREFEHLIRTTSKEAFLKNRRRIEFLAQVMPSEYAKRVEKKRIELRIRD